MWGSKQLLWSGEGGHPLVVHTTPCTHGEDEYSSPTPGASLAAPSVK